MKRIVIALILTTLFCRFSSSAPTVKSTQVTVKALTFLEGYGYLATPDPRSGKLMTEESIASSIRQLQKFAGISETGVMDKATTELINTSRCGMSDFGPTDNAKRKRRYAQQGTKWNKEHLTWRYVDKNNDRLSPMDVRPVLAESLKKWSDVTNLSFREITDGTPDIWIRFVRGYHRDPYPFDGTGGTLAHAFYPMDNKGLSGDVHFDDDEHYTIGRSYGKSLRWVAVHELGHSIGLEHSNKRGAIMYPWYQSHHNGKDFDLTRDDIIGIQTIYGSKVQKEKRTPAPNPGTPPLKVTIKPPSRPGGCTGRIQAVFLGKDKKTYVINRDKVYVLGTNLGIEQGPKPVNKYFRVPGLKIVDATFTRHGDKNTVFFSRDVFYVFKGAKLFRGPRKITDGFSRLPRGFSDVNAAFIWPSNDKLYIFKGRDYYRFSRPSGYNYVKDRGYPRRISKAWGNVPDNVDAVFTWRNGISYFFKGSKYYRLNNRKIEVENGYPKRIASAWMYCPANLSSKKGGSHALRVTMATIFASIAALIKLL